MATLFETLQFFDDAAEPLSLGTVGWYEAGTSTLKTIWKDQAETSAHINPIPLDGDGRPPNGAIFIRGSYKMVVKDSAGITLQTIDYINEYDQPDFTGLTATVDDLNSTTTNTVFKTTTYTVVAADRGKTILCDATGGTFNINLSSAVTLGNKFKIIFKKIDISNNVITITPYGTETIDTFGNDKMTLADPNDVFEIQSDGSNWRIIIRERRGTTLAKTAAFSIAYNDWGKVELCNTASGSFNVTLLSCASLGRGYYITFKKIDASANEVTLIPNGAETIDGDALFVINLANQAVTIKTDGSNWFLLSDTAATDGFVTGDVKLSYKYYQPGWVVMQDGTIGKTGSGATARANDDTRDLFLELWNGFPDGYFPVTGGRGASAIADFNASKVLKLGTTAGRALYNRGSNGVNNFQAGQSWGEDNHTLSWNEGSIHTHITSQTYLYPLSQKNGTHHAALDNPGWGAVTNTMNNAGAGWSHNNVPLMTAMFVFIKL